MTHWGWYWKIKKRHSAKTCCDFYTAMTLDSFSMFKNKEVVQIIMASPDRISFEIPSWGLIATLMDNYSIRVRYCDGSYIIPVETKPCNYGGYYYFFHCPLCKARMRKLYFVRGIYKCRKCANFGYYSQRQRPTTRYMLATYDIEKFLKCRGGSLEQKPPWMKQATFQKIRRKYVKYDEKRFYAGNKEVLEWYGPRIERHLESSYLLFVSLPDAYVERLDSPLDPSNCVIEPSPKVQPFLFSLSNIFPKWR